MGIEDSQEDRLMAHAVPGDDPTWGEVSAFMEAVDSAYAEVPTTRYEAVHLAAISGAARSARNELHTSRRKTMKDLFTFKSRRVLIASVVAALLALTAGVGAASALGGGPLANLLPAAPTETSSAPEVTPLPTPTASDIEDGDDQGDDESDDPTPKATAPSTEGDDDSEKARESTGSHDSEESDDKAEKSHDDSDDQGGDSEDEGEDHDGKSGSHQGDSGDDGDNGGHEDDSED